MEFIIQLHSFSFCFFPSSLEFKLVGYHVIMFPIQFSLSLGFFLDSKWRRLGICHPQILLFDIKIVSSLRQWRSSKLFSLLALFLPIGRIYIFLFLETDVSAQEQ